MTTTFDVGAAQGYTLGQLQGIASDAAASNGVDQNFFNATIGAESSWNPAATNNTGPGAYGIAQFQPATAAQYGVTNPYDPSMALYGSASYFGNLLQQNGGDYVAASQQYGTLPSDLSGNLTEGQQQVLAAAQSANAQNGVQNADDIVNGTFPSSVSGLLTGGSALGSGAVSQGISGVINQFESTVSDWFVRGAVIMVGLIFMGAGLMMLKGTQKVITTAAKAVG